MIRRYTKQGGILIPLDSVTSPRASNSNGINTSTTAPVEVIAQASNTINTKGAWIEYIASTSQDTQWIEIAAYNNFLNGSDTSALLDVGIGASGSEQVLISNLACGHKASFSNQSGLPEIQMFPVEIAAGTRVSIRVQSVIADRQVTVAMRFLTSPFDINSSGIDTINANTANSNVTTELATAAINTKAAWTELVASTVNAYQGILIGMQLGPTQTSVVSGNYLLDIAIGPGGSEQIIIQDLPFTTGSSETVFRRLSQSFFQYDIPAGTRIAARFQRSSTQQRCCPILYGVKN